MFRNYMKIAFKVLLRRKFFTFISLFGIAFTLIVLNITTAIYERQFSNDGPELKMDRILMTNMLDLYGGNSHRNGWASIPFLKKYFTNLESPEYYSIYSRRNTFVSFLDGKKFEINKRYTDHNYWNMFDFNFKSGKAFTEEQLNNAKKVVVINEFLKAEYFPNEDALGKIFTIEGESFRVIGVVENISENKKYNYSDLWIPYTSQNENLNTSSYHDDYHISFLAKSSADFDKIKKEFVAIIPNIPILDKRFKNIRFNLDSKFEAWTRSNYGRFDSASNGMSKFFMTAIALLAAFLLLPALNLININISRIMERSSEIGVRKSFGASSKTLVYQFVIENIILTLVGGLIALIISYFVMNQISALSIIRFESYHLNFTVFMSGLAFALFFGFISGVLPAYKMSKLSPVDALKGAIK